MVLMGASLAPCMQLHKSAMTYSDVYLGGISFQGLILRGCVIVLQMLAGCKGAASNCCQASVE